VTRENAIPLALQSSFTDFWHFIFSIASNSDDLLLVATIWNVLQHYILSTDCRRPWYTSFYRLVRTNHSLRLISRHKFSGNQEHGLTCIYKSVLAVGVRRSGGIYGLKPTLEVWPTSRASLAPSIDSLTAPFTLLSDRHL